MSEHEYLSCVEALESGVCLNREQWRCLLLGRTEEHADLLAHKAAALRDQIVPGRGCLSGDSSNLPMFAATTAITAASAEATAMLERYRLTKEEILACCQAGHRLGFRTFVLQRGRTDPWYTDAKVQLDIVRYDPAGFPDCAITLSLGEKGAGKLS